MNNALILHGTDFEKEGNNRNRNWFPWLDTQLTQLGYEVWRPELPEPWHPNLDRYWNVLKNFDYNAESILVGHSSGAATVFGLLNKLAPTQNINLAISVAGFYKDEGWHCEGLFSEKLNWGKIKNQAKTHVLIWSPSDPYISVDQTKFLSQKLGVEPITIPQGGHFNETSGFIKFPELLNVIKNSV